ncbi:hypothetical protein V1527DRAFT_95336 [Lipomyces starkeyi]
MILAMGYDPTEYDGNLWNVQGNLRIVQIDYQPCDFECHYWPVAELVGSIKHNITA